jgi:polysaccharide biosynthesis protein PslH
MNICIVTSEPTHPTTAGNRARVVSIVEECMAARHNVHILLLCEEEEGVSKSSVHYGLQMSVIRPGAWMRSLEPAGTRTTLKKLIQTAKNIGGSIVPDTWKIWKTLKNKYVSQTNIDHYMPEAIAKEAAERILATCPDVVIINYVYNSLILDYIPEKILKIIDTHDVFTERFSLFKKIGIEPEFFSFTKEAEQKGLSRAHRIIAITAEEKLFFENLHTPPCTVVGYIGEMIEPSSQNDQSEVVFGILGSCNLLNVASMEWLIQQVLTQPSLSELPFRLVVGGNLDRMYVKRKLDPRIQFLGRVEYDEFYSMTDVILNPMMNGTGLKYKSCEALARGKPLLTTTIGASGLTEGANEAFQVADTPEAFAKAMRCCITEPDSIQSLGIKGWHFMEHYMNQQRSALQAVLSYDASLSS